MIPSQVNRRRAGHAAFTLVEILVATVIGVAAIALVMGMVVTQSRLSASIGNYHDMNAQNRHAMSLMEADLRATNSIQSMTADTLNFKIVSDVSTNPITGAVSPPLTGVSLVTIAYTYDKSQGTLSRKVTDPAGKVVADSPVLTNIKQNVDAAGVDVPIFIYFNSRDQPLDPSDVASPALVKKILINAKMQRGLVNALNTDYLVSAVVVLRANAAK